MKGKNQVDANNLLEEAISKGPYFDVALYLGNLDLLDETNFDTVL